MIDDTRPISWVIAPAGEPIYSTMATTVTIVDEGAGEFIEIKQYRRSDAGTIAIDCDEWIALRDAIDHAVKQCRAEPAITAFPHTAAVQMDIRALGEKK